MLHPEPSSAFISIGGSRVRLHLSSTGVVRLDEGSGQCSACGDDIVDTGRHVGGLVTCDCGASYPLRRGKQRTR